MEPIRGSAALVTPCWTPLPRALAVIGVSLASLPLASAQTGITRMLLKDPSGGPTVGGANQLDATPDGRFVAFRGNASFLAAWHIGFGTDYNDWSPIYVLDRRSGEYEVVSLSSNGSLALGNCTWPTISSDGNVIAFVSDATNIVLNPDVPWTRDVFVRDRRSGITELISVTTSGAVGDGDSTMPAVSGDGRFVAFVSASNRLVSMTDPCETWGWWWNQIYVRDRLLQQTELVSVSPSGGFSSGGGSRCISPAISEDGRFVAFASYALNLTAKDGNAWFPDVYVRDRQSATTEIVSVDNHGEQGRGASGFLPSWPFTTVEERTLDISADGRVVAFITEPTSGLVPVPANYWTEIIVVTRDRQAGSTQLGSIGNTGEFPLGSSTLPVLSPDGRFLAFHSESGNLVSPPAGAGIYLRDRLDKTTRYASKSTGGAAKGASKAPPAIGTDGREVLFISSGLTPQSQKSYPGPLPFVHEWRPAIPFHFLCRQPTEPFCSAVISSLGHPSASDGEGFQVGFSKLPRDSWSQAVYGVSGPAATPFSTGVLCVQGALRRMGQLNRMKGPKKGPIQCQGFQTVDVARFIESGEDPALVPGVTVHLQCIAWVPLHYPHPNAYVLSPAVAFTIQP